MKPILLVCCGLLWLQPITAQPKDWLIDGSSYQTEAILSPDKKQLELSNGLLRRTFALAPNGATIALDNLMTGQSELRAVRPEALLVINGKEYPVGGLEGQPVHNFLTKEFLKEMRRCDSAFVLTDYAISETKERFAWKPNKAWISNDYAWPAPGKRVTFTYKAPTHLADCQGLTVRVIYELYDTAPILSKWIKAENNGTKSIRLDRFKSEILALTETAPKVHYGEPHEARMMAQEPGYYTKDYRRQPVQTDAPRDYIDRFTQLFVVTDYAMGGDMEAMKDNPAVRWVFDHPEYEFTGIRYYGQYKPARLEVTPLLGPAVTIAAGESFTSCRAFEMLRDATDQERRRLAECRFWRMMAPWTQENPIFMHVRQSDDAAVKQAIDQCAAVGFEMVIMTFGSGFQIENDSASYLERMKNLRQYATDKGIAIGGYSLLASRGARPEDAAISHRTGKPAQTREEGSRFGVSPCIASEWGDRYFQRLTHFFETTGMNVFENDGVVTAEICWSMPHTKHLKTTYTFSGDGSVRLAMSLNVKCSMERYGFTFRLAEGIDGVSLYGKGPHENYCDRATGAELGVWSGKAEEMIHDYLYPQENGNHTGVRYASIGDKEGVTLRAVGKPFEMTVHPYTYEMLQNAQHLHELGRENALTVCVDGKQRGVGGDTPAMACTKPQYDILPGKIHTLDFTLKFNA